MSSATSTLPVGWSSILEEVHMRLDHAIALTDARVAQLPHLEGESMAHEQKQEIAKWSDRLQRLSDYLLAADQVVQNLDAILLYEETLVREKVTSCGTLRQKLAEGTGRAIG